MEPVPPPADAERILSSLGVLDGRAAADVDAVLASVEWLSVPAGERLFSVGDPPDGMYVIASGRVRFFADEHGAHVATAEAGEGVSFGEGAMLSGSGRSRAAVVVRDAVLGRVPPAEFHALLASSPAMAARIARIFAARIAFEDSTREAVRTVDHTVVVADGVDTSTVRWLADELARQTGATVSASCEPCAPTPSIVVSIPEPGEPPSICRHAGRVMIVVSAGDLPGRRPPIQPALEQIDPLARPVTDLVLVRLPNDRRPAQTNVWLARHEPANHFFVTAGRVADVERLGRHLGSRAIGLVLGGGGARGMAHIGVLRALAELHIPVDAVGGSSIGAVVGAQLALGWTWQEMAERNRAGWARVRRPRYITLPTVSISSGRGIRRLLDRWFTDIQIEDLQLPFFCTTVNLSRFRLEVHHSGSAAQWIRAGCSAPGLWPPVVDDDGELHVDGGQLNNVPSDVMRLEQAGTVVAVDVASAQSAMTVPRGATPVVGVRHLVRRRARARFPSLVDTFGRCALLGSLQQREQAAAHADVYLTPDCSAISFTGFKRIDQAIDIGYRVTVDALADVELPVRATPNP